VLHSSDPNFGLLQALNKQSVCWLHVSNVQITDYKLQITCLECKSQVQIPIVLFTLIINAGRAESMGWHAGEGSPKAHI
jgi:hypothetical protein